MFNTGQTDHPFKEGDIFDTCWCNDKQHYHIYLRVIRECSLEEYVNDPGICPDGFTHKQWLEHNVGPNFDTWENMAKEKNFKFYLLGDIVGRHMYVYPTKTNTTWSN